MAWEHVDMDPSRTAYVWFGHVKDDVEREMVLALSKHGVPTKDPCRGLANLTEELGEVAKEVIEATRPGVDINKSIKHLDLMCYELNQVAAYAMLLRCSMEGVIREMKSGTK